MTKVNGRDLEDFIWHRFKDRIHPTHKVRLWLEDGKVLCCSSVCTEQSCPRVGICKETEIREVLE